MTAATLLDMARQPGAWAPSWDRAPRWRFEHALRRSHLSAGAAGFAAVLVCAMNADGTLPARVGRDELCARARTTWRSFSRWCAELEHAGLIRRVYQVRPAGPGEWRREVTIRTAERFDNPVSGQAADLRKRHSVSPLPHKDSERSSPRVAVGGYLSGRNARVSDDQADPQPSLTEREQFAQHWPQLARSRKHVPDCQPSARRWIRPVCGKCQTVHNWHELCPGDRQLLAADPEPVF